MMKLRELLNDFEIDWAEAPLRQPDFPLKGFEGKVIAVVGNSGVTEALLVSFLAALESGKVCFSLIWCPMAEEKDWCLKPELRTYEGLTITTPEGLERADFLLYNGLCSRDIDDPLEAFQPLTAEAEEVLKTAARVQPGRFLLLSDYRALARENTGMYISEYEHSLAPFAAPEAMERMLFQYVEALARSYGKQESFPCSILRFPMILGGCIRHQNHFAHRLAAQIAAGEEVRLRHTNACYTYIYINDVLSAIWCTLLCAPENTVYHAAAPGEPVTPEEIYAIIYRNFPKAKVTFAGDGEADLGLAMSAQKLRLYGWEPLVPFEDALVLEVRSLQDPGQIFLFRQAYQGKLNEIHQLLLGHLLEIDRICKKNDIKYFLAGGTLLGAIRHHGFIPWDDDADVMMTRDQYEKFSAVVQRDLPGTLFYQSNQTEEINHAVFRKVRINNTVFATEHTAKFPTMHNGVFADVISHDATADHKAAQKVHVFLTRLNRALVFNKWAHSSVREREGTPHWAVLGMNFIKELLPMSLLEWSNEHLMTLFKHKKHPKYYYDSMGRNISRGAFPAEYLEEAIEVDFEGYKLPVPKEYDKYLTWLYGDYMKLIPASQRHTSHSIVWMDLGEYENFQLK